MTTPTPDGYATPVSIPGQHGLLHGQLALQPGARGLIVLAQAAMALDARESVLAAILRRGGLSTLSIDLLSRQEERFSDAQHNIPLLARRLLDVLGLLKNQMQLGEIDAQPLGLYADNATTPVVVRVAALRDHDIAAVVCRGGLIDLAGALYLRALESPLLLLVEDADEQRLASNRRALHMVHCAHELKRIPEIGIDFAASAGFEVAADQAAQWFARHVKHASRQSP